MSEFDAKEALNQLNIHATTIRKKRFIKSRLDKYKGELFLLKKEGATIADLQRWLRTKRIKVAWSTVDRWIKKHG